MRTLTRAALLFLLLSLLASALPVAAAPVLVSPIDGATTARASYPPLGFFR